jgi:hypothetical protein
VAVHNPETLAADDEQALRKSGTRFRFRVFASVRGGT